MPANKRPDPSKKPRQKSGAELRFTIDAFTPETMPMARLAEYMAQLATILGEPSAVHFLRVEPGSTVPVISIEREAVPKVRARAISVRRGEGPPGALAAFKTVNRYLREDNGVAELKENRAATPILRFPGRDAHVEKYPAIRETGTLDGFVRRVGGWDKTVHVLLDSDGEQIVGAFTDDEKTAKRLGAHLFEPVRLIGAGRWRRDSEGVWELEEFRIDRFEVLKNVQLSSALKRIRAIGGDWAEGTYDELAAIRHGKRGKVDGGR